MEQRVQDTANQLINQLMGGMAEAEDAESAIQAYKLANYVISQLDRVKTSALALAEQDMKARGLENVRTPEGTAGWTEPKVKQLDERAWHQALARDNDLMRVQREYDQAQAALDEARRPYLTLPESRFYIH